LAQPLPALQVANGPSEKATLDKSLSGESSAPYGEQNAHGTPAARLPRVIAGNEFVELYRLALKLCQPSGVKYLPSPYSGCQLQIIASPRSETSGAHPPRR
jgi:hypothetical protein